MEYNITATIVTFCNDLPVLKKAIQSFLDTDLSVKLYIVDNSPTNKIKTLCSDGRIEYLINTANIGFGAGHNKILNCHEKLGGFHLILNPDIYYERGTLEKLYLYMNDNPDVGLLMPKVLYEDGSHQYLPKLFPTPLDLLVRRLPFPDSMKNKVNNRYEMRFANYKEPFEIPIASGCFSMINSEIIREGFKYDESFFMYFEDFDFSRRVGQHYKIVCYPLAIVYHVYGRGAHNNLRLLRIFIQSMVKYFNKWSWFFDRERKIRNSEAIKINTRK